MELKPWTPVKLIESKTLSSQLSDRLTHSLFTLVHYFLTHTLEAATSSDVVHSHPPQK